jgi:WD repeat-containing protein 35
VGNPKRAKHLFVLAALDVERHRKRALDLSGGGGGGGGASSSSSSSSSSTAAAAATAGARTMISAATLNAAGATQLSTPSAPTADVTSYGTSLTSQLSPSAAAAANKLSSRTLDRAWHGAEAYHFMMLAQRLLYGGETVGALCVAARLACYEDVLPPGAIFSLQALAAFYSGAFGTCSRAFVKLEAMETLPGAAREAYGALALSIFSRTRPIDREEAGTTVVCPAPDCKAVLKCWATSCNSCKLAFKPCVATGRPLLVVAGAGVGVGGGAAVLHCKFCRHGMLASAVKDRVSCPLCAAQLFEHAAGAAASV